MEEIRSGRLLTQLSASVRGPSQRCLRRFHNLQNGVRSVGIPGSVCKGRGRLELPDRCGAVAGQYCQGYFICQVLGHLVPLEDSL